MPLGYYTTIAKGIFISYEEYEDYCKKNYYRMRNETRNIFSFHFNYVDKLKPVFVCIYDKSYTTDARCAQITKIISDKLILNQSELDQFNEEFGRIPSENSYMVSYVC